MVGVVFDGRGDFRSACVFPGAGPVWDTDQAAPAPAVLNTNGFLFRLVRVGDDRDHPVRQVQSLVFFAVFPGFFDIPCCHAVESVIPHVGGFACGNRINNDGGLPIATCGYFEEPHASDEGFQGGFSKFGS